MRFATNALNLGFDAFVEPRSALPMPIGAHGQVPSLTEEATAEASAGPTGLIRHRNMAVVAADIANYCCLIEQDPLDTALRVRWLRGHLLQPAVLAHHGRVVDCAGDAALLAFPEAAQAVGCALAVQRRLELAESGRPAERRIRLRIGISRDEVLLIENELYGTAVNVAARLMALGEPGEICLTEAVAESLNPELKARCEALGPQAIRNIACPVQVHRIGRARMGG